MKPLWHYGLAAVLSVGLLIQARRPFGTDQEGILGTSFVGEILSNYERFGFLECQGRPLRFAWPTREPSGWAYLHHPPTVYWLLWPLPAIVGSSPFILRLLPTIASIFLLVSLTRLVTARAGSLAGFAFLAALGTSVLWWNYAGLVNFEPFVMALAAIAFIHASRPTAAYRPWSQALLGFAATSVDWIGGGVVLASACVGWIVSGSFRHALRVGVHGAIGTCVAIVCVLLVDLAWTGSVENLSRLLLRAGEHAARWSTLRSAAEFQMDNLPKTFGWVTTILVPFGFLKLFLMARRSPNARLLLGITIGWILLGLLNVVGFATRAADHEFWFLFALPGFAIAVAGLAMSDRPRRLRAGWVAALIVAGALVQVPALFLDLRSRHLLAQPPLRFAELVNGYAPPDSLIVFPMDFRHSWVWRYYAKALARPAVEIEEILAVALDPVRLDEAERAGIESAIRRFQAGEFTVSRLIVIARHEHAHEAILRAHDAQLEVVMGGHSIWRLQRQ